MSPLAEARLSARSVLEEVPGLSPPYPGTKITVRGGSYPSVLGSALGSVLGSVLGTVLVGAEHPADTAQTNIATVAILFLNL